MAYDAKLAERIRIVIQHRSGFTEKKMFGGVGFLLNGNMCIGIWKEWLIVRLGAEQCDSAFSQPHVRKFDITGRAMKGWAMIAPEAIDDDEDLRNWIDRAARFVRGLPPKVKTARPQPKSSRRRSR